MMDKVKRAFSLLLALCLCAALLPAPAYAAGDWEFDSNDVIVGYNGSGSHVTVPEGAAGIGGGVFCGRTDITQITLPNTITFIGESAFSGCSELTAVTIPGSVTSIGSSAFENCTKLTEITIPDTVTSVGGDLFAGCTGLTSAVAGGKAWFYVGLSGGGMFKDCTSLKSVAIKEGAGEIPSSTFENCTSLTSVVIPNSVVKISPRAFYGCTGLTSVTLGNHVNWISEEAFGQCGSLKSINLPASLLRTTYSMFYGCTGLESITLADGISSLRLSDSWFMRYDTGHTPADLPNPVRKIFVPASVTHVEDGALDVCADDVTIYGMAGSYIEKYTSLRGIPFVANNFGDVAFSAYYAQPVFWALENNITTGATPTSFTPTKPCTHAQILTFLHRALDKPPAGVQSPVPVDEAYQDAVAWAYEKGMIGEDFVPSAPCTRAEAVLYIWQAMSTPDASLKTAFIDVPVDAAFAGAVAWAVEKGVTTGTTATTFSPNKVCNRGEIVTFLYRAFN